MAENEVVAIANRLYRRQPYQSLLPQNVWDPALSERIDALSVDPAVKSGLHLWNDNLTVSHRLSQTLHHKTGSYWHGIMHRMEPDYSNAKYWFRQVGRHPVYDEINGLLEKTFRSGGFKDLNETLAERLLAILAPGQWDAFRFVDEVEAAAEKGDPDWIGVLERIQRAEIALLLQYTYREQHGGQLFEEIAI